MTAPRRFTHRHYPVPISVDHRLPHGMSYAKWRCIRCNARWQVPSREFVWGALLGWVVVFVAMFGRGLRLAWDDLRPWRPVILLLLAFGFVGLVR